MDHNTILAALMLRNRDSGTSGLPSGSSPNQYLVTDGEGNAKWEDKLAWSEKSTKEVLPETFVAEPADQMDNLTAYLINCVLEEGKKYTVIYNGVAYDVISKSPDEGFVVVGNEGISGNGADTGEPFLMTYNDSFGGTMVVTTDSDGITITIYGEGETIHPIDKKYLPSDNLRVFITMDENDEYVSSHTYEEIKSHVLSGGTCDCVMGQYIMHLSEATFMSDVQPFDLVVQAVFTSIDPGYVVNRVCIAESGAVFIGRVQLSYEDDA